MPRWSGGSLTLPFRFDPGCGVCQRGFVVDKPKSEFLEKVCELLEQLTHHELHWLQLHGIRAVQQKKRGVKTTPPKPSGGGNS